MRKTNELTRKDLKPTTDVEYGGRTEEKEVAQTIFDFSLFDSVPEVEPQKDLDSILNEEKIEQVLKENSSSLKNSFS